MVLLRDRTSTADEVTSTYTDTYRFLHYFCSLGRVHVRPPTSQTDKTGRERETGEGGEREASMEQ